LSDLTRLSDMTRSLDVIKNHA